MTEIVTVGNCTLMLGDARELVPAFGEFDAVVTDPPYGMAFRSNHRTERHAPIANDDDVELFLWACSIPARHSRYVFCRWDGLRVSPLPKSCVTWVKNNWSMGDLEHEHARQTEVCLFWPGPSHKWPQKRPTDVVYAPRTANADHPTEKPVYLMEQVVGWTQGVVLDPFMGAGATAVACVNLGREFVGIELDRGYFETAVERVRAACSQGRLFA